MYSGYNYKVKRTTAEDGSLITVVLLNCRLYNNGEQGYKNTKKFNLTEMLNSDEEKSPIEIPNTGTNSVINIYKNDKLLISWDCDFSEEFEDAKQLNPNEISFNMNLEGNYLKFNISQEKFTAENYHKKEIKFTTPPMNVRSLVYISELGFDGALKETIDRNVTREIATACNAKDHMPVLDIYPKNLYTETEKENKKVI